MSEVRVSRAEIAEFLGAAAGSGGGVDVSRVASIERADADAVVFAAEDHALAEALASRAGVILARREVADDARVLVVDDPRTAFARIFARWFSGASAAGSIHAEAVVSALAKVGAGCEIGAGAVIEEFVELGVGCRIGPRVVIHAGTRVGDRVRVQAGAVLGSDGFGYVWHGGQHLGFPQIGTLVIEDDVEIGANTTIDRGALRETRIGRGTKIDNLVHIAHNCVIGRDVLIAAQVGMAGSTRVEDGAMLGGQAGIGEHATIGRGVILGGQGGVLPGKTLSGEGVVFWGTPAQPVREFLRDVARIRRGKV